MLRKIRGQCSWIAFLLMISIVGQACSDTVTGGIIMPADAHGDAKNLKFDGKGSDGQTADSDEDIQGIDVEEHDVGCKRVIYPNFDNSKAIVLAPADQLSLFVTVADYALGGPAQEVPVSWEIVENNGINGPGPGTLSNQIAPTDVSGHSLNLFHPNKGPSTAYKLKITAECAEPIFVDIIVSAFPTGNIEVNLLYDNQIPLGDVSVKLVASPFACASFKPTLPPSSVLGSQLTYISAPPTKFPSQPADKKYGVFVLAKDLSGHLAAAGCADGVYVNDKATTKVTVTVTVLPLQAAGPYDMINHFDFTGAIPGQLGQILDTAVQIFYDPGTFLIEQIKNLVKQFIPSIVVDVVFSLFEKQLSKAVTDWLLNSSPSWLQDFFTMGQDVLQIVKKLEMLGVLKIYKVGSDFFFNGEIDFTGVNLYWKLGCDKNDPNYADCGKLSLDMSQAVTDPNFPLDLLAGKLSGSISQQTHMSIDSSSITLNYGKLILYVLTNVVLKKITGKTTFVGAMQALINCAGIGSSLGGIIPGLNSSQVESFCNSTVSLLVLPLENLLGGLSLDSGLSLKGTCTMVDDADADGNYDLKVDRLIDGVWVGNINVQGSTGKNFKGDFTAKRQPGF